MSDRRCDPLSMALSAQLDTHRRLQGKTYKALHLPPSTISKCLDGHSAYTSTFHKLADALDCTITVTVTRRKG